MLFGGGRAYIIFTMMCKCLMAVVELLEASFLEFDPRTFLIGVGFQEINCSVKGVYSKTDIIFSI